MKIRRNTSRQESDRKSSRAARTLSAVAAVAAFGAGMTATRSGHVGADGPRQTVPAIEQVAPLTAPDMMDVIAKQVESTGKATVTRQEGTGNTVETLKVHNDGVDAAFTIVRDAGTELVLQVSENRQLPDSTSEDLQFGTPYSKDGPQFSQANLSVVKNGPTGATEMSVMNNDVMVTNIVNGQQVGPVADPTITPEVWLKQNFDQFEADLKGQAEAWSPVEQDGSSINS